MKNIVFALLVLLSAVCSLAQNSGVKDLKFNRLSVENGMPGFAVFSTIEDKQNYRWLACINGVARYNGYTPKIYNLGITSHTFYASVVYEDRKGTIWVGTGYYGLYWYDRSSDRFQRVVLSASDSVVLSHNYIMSLQDDRDGNLWMKLTDANKEVIWYLHTKTGTVQTFGMEETGNSLIPAKHFNGFLEDRNGNMWIGSDNGFYMYNQNGKKISPYFTNVDISKQQTISYLCEDARHTGTFWFYASFTKGNVPNGLWQWNTTAHSIHKFYRTKAVNSIASNTVFSIKNDKKGQLWISTDKGLSRFAPDSQSFTNYSLGTDATNNNEIIYEWCEDDKENFWCRPEFGLLYFNTQTGLFSHYPYNRKDEEAVAVQSTDLSVDHTGILWLRKANGNQGMQWINKDRSRFAWYTDKPGNATRQFKGGQIVDYAETSDSTVWMATEKGLYHWFPKTDSFELIEQADYRGKKLYVMSMRADKEGNIWYGVNLPGIGQHGLDCYNPRTHTLTHYLHDDANPASLKNNMVFVICRDRQDNIWTGGDSGYISCFNKKTSSFTWYQCRKANDAQNVTAGYPDYISFLYEDRKGTMWVCSNTGGIFQLNKATGEVVARPDIVPSTESPICIIEDSKNRLWISTMSAGIYCFDYKTNHTRKYTTKDGLLFDGATGIEEDKQGSIWLTSLRGISILKPETSSVRTLTRNKTLPDDINAYSFHMKDGTFLFSGYKGFIALNPDDYIPDTITPVVHIETVNFTNPSAPVAEQKDSSLPRWGKKEIYLSYDNNKVTFSYVGIHYQNATATQYAYRLDNYDKRWIEAGTDRTATYTSLNPGTYTFHVKAANGDGVWSKKEDAITIIIATPWWQTWWFYTLVALAAFGLIYLIYRYQLNQALKVERVRNRIASDLHDEIGSTLSAITLFSQIAHDQSKTTVASPQLLQRINETAQKVTQTMRDIVWSVSTKNDSFEKMITHMHEHAAELLDLKGYELHFTADEKLAEVSLSMEKRQNIYLMYKEALNNIVKHAGGSEVWIRIARERKHLVLHLKDNGIGFDCEKGYTGNGLQNIKNRAASVHGSVTFHSGTGGSEVEIKVPV